MATSNTAPVPAKSDAPAKSGALHGNLLILGATLFFGVNIPVVKFLNPEWLTSNDITLFRLGGGCILFWLASLLTRGDNRIARADFPRILAGGASASLPSSSFSTSRCATPTPSTCRLS